MSEVWKKKCLSKKKKKDSLEESVTLGSHLPLPKKIHKQQEVICHGTYRSNIFHTDALTLIPFPEQYLFLNSWQIWKDTAR